MSLKRQVMSLKRYGLERQAIFHARLFVGVFKRRVCEDGVNMAIDAEKIGPRTRPLNPGTLSLEKAPVLDPFLMT